MTQNLKAKRNKEKKTKSPLDTKQQIGHSLAPAGPLANIAEMDIGVSDDD